MSKSKQKQPRHDDDQKAPRILKNLIISRDPNKEAFAVVITPVSCQLN